MERPNIDDPCALCGRPLGTDPTKDHVFGEGFGSKVTVWAHRSCNSQFGGDAEGILHRPGSFMTFAKVARGVPAPVVSAVDKEGRRLAFDLSTGESWVAEPKVDVRDEPDQVHLSLYGGNETQARAVVKSWQRNKEWGHLVPNWADLLPVARRRIQEPPVDARIDEGLDARAAEHFAIKALLGAGVIAFGYPFATSALASGLRDRLQAPFHSPFEPGPHPGKKDLGALSAMDRVMRRPPLDTGWPYLGSEPEGLTYSAVFMAMKTSTIMFVHILGFSLPWWGLVIDVPMESSCPTAVGSLPVLIREQAGQVTVTDFGALVLERGASGSIR